MNITKKIVCALALIACCMPQQTKPVNWKQVLGGLAIITTGYVLYETYKSYSIEKKIDLLLETVKKQYEEQDKKSKTHAEIAFKLLRESGLSHEEQEELVNYRGIILCDRYRPSAEHLFETYFQKKAKALNIEMSFDKIRTDETRFKLPWLAPVKEISYSFKTITNKKESDNKN